MPVCRRVACALTILLIAGLSSKIASAGSAPSAAVDRKHRLEKSSTSETSKGLTASMIESLERGEPQNLLVRFDDAIVVAEASKLKAATPDLLFDTQEILDLKAARYSATKAKALSDAKDIEVLRDYSHLPIAFLRFSSLPALTRFIARTEVLAVRENRTYRQSLAESLPLIGQPTVAGSGRTGAGATVAVLDTGVDYARSAFGSCTAPGVPAGCKVVYAQDFTFDDGQRDASPDFHGTNVAAIVLGVAPGARIAALDVFDGDLGDDNAILAAGNWCIANRSAYNIVAANLSLGTGAFGTPCSDPVLDAAVANARAAGILIVAASGNDGYASAIAAPACVPGVLSVGAVYDSNVGPMIGSICSDTTTAADQVTCFSNSYSALTVLAPGARITAAGETLSGTSMAAPHLAGAIAVLRSAFPSETLYRTVSRLVNSGTQRTDPGNGLPKPRLNLAASVGPATSDCSVRTIQCSVPLSATLLSSDCNWEQKPAQPGYFETYQFSGTAGQTVTVDMASFHFDTRLALRNPAGVEVAANDDIVPGSNTNSRITYTLNSSGSWRIQAYSFWAGESGPYSLSLSCSTVNPAVCTPGSGTLCLAANRFRVSVSWRTASPPASGSGIAVALAPDTGYFWFFNGANVELVVKILDARVVNGKFWVFYGALSNVEYTITVADTQTGAVRTYFNPQGTLASFADTSAF